MDTCPHCGRKLLSHISARCNWCGAEIEDRNYQAQADVARAALHAEQALHDLQSLTITQNTNNNFWNNQAGGMFGLPAISPLDAAATFAKRAEYEAWEQTRREAIVRAQNAAATEPPAAEPVDETQERFEHLEL